MAALVFISLAALLALFVWAYNTVVARKNGVENAFGAIEAQLKKRRDLIPNLTRLHDLRGGAPGPRFGGAFRKGVRR